VPAAQEVCAIRSRHLPMVRGGQVLNFTLLFD
jgi:hypothetical protein